MDCHLSRIRCVLGQDLEDQPDKMLSLYPRMIINIHQNCRRGRMDYRLSRIRLVLQRDPEDQPCKILSLRAEDEPSPLSQDGLPAFKDQVRPVQGEIKRR